MSAFRVVPATSEDIRWVAGLAGQVFSGLDVIPESAMLEWFGRNPCGFSVVLNEAGERIGNVDLLPVRPDTLERLLAGTMLERELKADDLYAPLERADIRSLYLESVVGPGAGRAMRAEFPALVERVCDAASLEGLYAIAASAQGVRFLEKLGLTKIADATARRDGHDLYGKRA